jgi:hypothetical protein
LKKLESIVKPFYLRKLNPSTTTKSFLKVPSFLVLVISFAYCDFVTHENHLFAPELSPGYPSRREVA